MRSEGDVESSRVAWDGTGGDGGVKVFYEYALNLRGEGV